MTHTLFLHLLLSLSLSLSPFLSPSLLFSLALSLSPSSTLIRVVELSGAECPSPFPSSICSHQLLGAGLGGRGHGSNRAGSAQWAISWQAASPQPLDASEQAYQQGSYGANWIVSPD